MTWLRHQMKTFSALLAICAGNSPATSEFPAQRPVTQSSDDFFDLRLNKRLSKQWRGWRFETPSRSLWRQWNEKCRNADLLMHRHATCRLYPEVRFHLHQNGACCAFYELSSWCLYFVRAMGKHLKKRTCVWVRKVVFFMLWIRSGPVFYICLTRS